VKRRSLGLTFRRYLLRSPPFDSRECGSKERFEGSDIIVEFRRKNSLILNEKRAEISSLNAAKTQKRPGAFPVKLVEASARANIT